MKPQKHALARPAGITALFMVCLAAALPGVVRAAEGYYRYPTIHDEVVVFTAEGDLWKIPAQGGSAVRLTSHPGEENCPEISPDGQTLAFSAQYEGPREVYTMPLSGGLPTRQTWLGRNARPAGWTPSGEIIFSTSTYSTLPNLQLVRLDPRTGGQSVIPLSPASGGSYDPSGKIFFFTRSPGPGSFTKRYRGGTAQNIWRYAEGDAEAVPLTADYPGTSSDPMVWQDRIYFLSDRDGWMNLYSMSWGGKALKQHTRHQGFDAKTPSLSAGRIVYQLGADLYIYEITTDQDRKIEIRLASDFDQMRETWCQKPMDYLTAAHPSPNGDRVVLTARGQVFVAPAKTGRLVEATRKAGVRYRSARFFPNGKSLLALSDESGEVEFVRLPANGAGAESLLTRGGKVLRTDGVSSPNGAWIVFADKNQELWLAEASSGKLTRIDQSLNDSFSDLRWSPDSRWLAYVKNADNLFSQIFLYGMADRTITPLTTDRYDSYSPAWSPDGKWIYFLSDRTLISLTGGVWGSRQPEPYFDRPTKIYGIPLRLGERSPFQQADELHPEGENAKDAAAGPERKNGGKGEKSRDKGKEGKGAGAEEQVKVEIDRQGIEERLREVPLAAGNYGALSVNSKRLYFLSYDTAPDPERTLEAFEIGAEKKEVVDLVDDVLSYELCADGSKLLLRKKDALYLLDSASDGSAELEKAAVDLSGWTFSIDPHRERRQMLIEAWRLERDYFYDTKMHGVDWKAVLEKYLPVVDRVTDRAELSDLLGEMAGELSALHTYVFGGDLRQGPEQIQPANLGAVLSLDRAAGGYRVEQIYRSDPDQPEALSPLLRPGVEVKEGEVIEQINGIDLLSAPDPGAVLRNQAGKQVLLQVRGKDGARDVIVTPLTPNEGRELRYASWEYGRKRMVEQRGGGAIGYVHLRGMEAPDYAQWSREFYPVYQRQGLIIDLRSNNGGNIDSWILEKLLRRAWMWWQPRVGHSYSNMPYAFTGHLAVIVDENTVSDGEAFAEGFRRLGLGKVIGTRTWGGEIWLSMSNRLEDNGIATAAETGVYGPDGEWLIEGHGVDPDIVVDNPPHATFAGEDAQLTSAVTHLQELIRNSPVTTPAPPPYPDKSFHPGRK